MAFLEFYWNDAEGPRKIAELAGVITRKIIVNKFGGHFHAIIKHNVAC